MERINSERFHKLIDIYTLINSDFRDPKGLLSHIIESAASLVGADSASLLLLDPMANRLVFEIALGEKADKVKEFSLKPGEGIAGWVVEHNRSLLVNDVSSDKRFYGEIDRQVGYQSQSILAVPLRIRERCFGVLEVISNEKDLLFSQEDLEWLEIFSNQASLAIDNARLFQRLINSGSEGTTKKNLEIIGDSKAMTGLLQMTDRIAPTDSPILIQGESGTGKELLAKLIHRKSSRREGPMISVNCAAIPEDLVEMEFFGYVKGAFTGADRIHNGKFEQANGGTLFLDEIGELSPDAQSKILRVLESGQVEKLGDTHQNPVDVRIIAATNRDLAEEMDAGRFRKDLYFRIHVLPLQIPSLRERQEDIIPLAVHFLNRYLHKSRNSQAHLTPEATESLLAYHWPGNVRELENCIERALIVSPEEGITSEDLSLPLRIDKSREKYKDKTLKEAVTAFKKNYLEHVLEICGGNQTEASKALGIQRTYLSRLIKELKL